MKTKLTHCLLATLLGALCLPWSTAQAQPATFGNALAFNGINQYVSITNFGAIAPTNEVTVEFWAYAYALDEQAAFILEPDDFNNRFLAHVSYISGDTFWDFGDASADGRLAYPNPSDTVSNWVHYALVTSSADNTMRIYRNGVLDTSKVGMSPFVQGDYELRLGGDGGHISFNDLLDDFRVWNTARSSNQIAANYNHTLAGNEPGLLLYYRFDAAGGTVATNSATATGPGYNGTLANAPTWTNSGAPFLYFADGSTNVIDGIAVNVTDSVYVGSNGPNTSLLIPNGGMFSNSGSGYLGFRAAANNNLAMVTGAGSLWTNSANLYIGYLGGGNQLVVSNGGVLANAIGIVGHFEPNPGNNVAVVTGTGSLWSNRANLYVGNYTSKNKLVVSDGGVVANADGVIGIDFNSSSNLAMVTGPGSLWTNRGYLWVGYFGTGNQLLVSDGGVVANANGMIGSQFGSSSNLAVVTGTGSRWHNSEDLYVGFEGSGNQLVVSNGGMVQATSAYVGVNASSTNNRVTVDGGNLIITNSGGTAVLDIRRGTNVLNAGLIQTDNLLLTNSAGFFAFNGGTLTTSESTVDNGSPLVVGNGSSAATYQLNGNGLHTFTDGLVISAAATLTGSGTVDGPLTVQSGGNLSPSAPTGLLMLNNSPALQGSVLMVINKKGLNRTNNQIQVAASLAYGGNLIVSKSGFDDLAIGDSFQLFSATSYGGAFTVMNLPPPGPDLMWTNRLLVDGSIAVVPFSAPTIGGFAQAGTNLTYEIAGGSPGSAYELLTSTNVATPLVDWIPQSGGQFDWSGNAVITNGINMAEPERYFRVRAYNGFLP